MDQILKWRNGHEEEHLKYISTWYACGDTLYMQNTGLPLEESRTSIIGPKEAMTMSKHSYLLSSGPGE